MSRSVPCAPYLDRLKELARAWIVLERDPHQWHYELQCQACGHEVLVAPGDDCRGLICPTCLARHDAEQAWRAHFGILAELA